MKINRGLEVSHERQSTRIVVGVDGRGKLHSGMEGKANRKGAPSAQGTFDLDPATMGLGDGSGDAEP